MLGNTAELTGGRMARREQMMTLYTLMLRSHLQGNAERNLCF